MAVWKRLLLALTATLAVTVLLTALPHAGRRPAEDGRDLAVFRPVTVKRLGSDNLVDSMIGLRLSLKLKKVDWKQGVLSADLSAENMPDDLAAWMGDVQRMLSLAFAQTDNVSRVLLRIVEPMAVQQGAPVQPSYRLLAAVDVRRTDGWLPADLSRVGDANPVADAAWRAKLRMTLTGDVIRRFGSAAGGDGEPVPGTTSGL
ncbi:hypothetical protein [Paenibacillus humicola]|uniref:hypothetical protein n=1 Tax=Paenibacillus humicola TaxID=3110540 RepID=UPI00237B99AD|nr:hypothetical protein [Paenibacillus humicola]